MSWRPTKKEIASVSSLSGQERYAYLIKKCADEEIVWGLWGTEGWVLGADDAGGELVPIWLHHDYARGCVAGAWMGCAPRAISIKEWLDLWTPGMQKDGRRIAAFPTAADMGIVVEPDRCRRDLLEELSKYE